MTGSIRVVTVAATLPLTVRETAAATPSPARQISGSSYTPAIGDRVLAAFTAGRWYILGADQEPSWEGSGITAAGSGASISAVELIADGAFVSLLAKITLGSAISVPSDGNVGNVQVAQVSNSALWPVVNRGVGSGASGPLAAFEVDTDGSISIVAVAPGAALAVDDIISINGSYRR